MQHFSIKECSSKLQGDFSVQQFSRFCSQKVSKWQQESNQFVVKNFNQESQVRIQFTYFGDSQHLFSGFNVTSW